MSKKKLPVAPKKKPNPIRSKRVGVRGTPGRGTPPTSRKGTPGTGSRPNPTRRPTRRTLAQFAQSRGGTVRSRSRIGQRGTTGPARRRSPIKRGPSPVRKPAPKRPVRRTSVGRGRAKRSTRSRGR